jgi:aryl-alcohol dehydrogenase-like predicted oxidoreductase
MTTAIDRHRIIFGCGNFGGLGSSPTLRDKGDVRERALALLDHARDRGLTRFDTANTYGGGASETILGEWLAAQGKAFRLGAQIATKVGNPHGCPGGERPLNRAQVAWHLDRSLSRLGVERIDLYYLHEFDPVTPLAETLEALDRALAAGKIAAFGVSNAADTDLAATLVLATGPLRRAFACVQNEFNALERRDLETVIPLCVAKGLEYVAFSPLAGGRLTGKYRRGEAAAAGTRLGDAPGLYAGQDAEAMHETVERLSAIAAEQGGTVAQAALRDVLETPGVGALIIAPRSLAQFDDLGV